MKAVVRVYSNEDKNMFLEFTNGQMIVNTEKQRYELGFTLGTFFLIKTYWESSIEDWCYLDKKQFSSMLDARYASPDHLLKIGDFDGIVSCLDTQIKWMVDDIEDKHKKYIDGLYGNVGE